MALEDASPIGSVGFVRSIERIREDGCFPTEKEKVMMIKKVHNAIILSLGDKVLRQISKEMTTTDKVLDEQLDMFNKLILDLENIEVKVDDEDQALLMLCVLPRSHAYLKETLLYGKESSAFEEIQSTLYSKDLNERKEKKPSPVGEGLPVKGKFLRKDGKYVLAGFFDKG
ncbi:unnamed protein product [Lathyrus oleraceus]